MVVSQKIGNQATSKACNTTLDIYPKKAYSHHKDMCSAMFIATFIIARTWKKPRCPSDNLEEWIRKNVVHWYNVLLSGKTNDILKFACKWTELEKVKMSEVTQGHKDKYNMYSLMSR
ncbi:Retrovirus-related Pol polyprotein LINE-1 [Cricetulus griseus]|uniref:Retrovirus-related Pol polyprotein LINE-1 n=1 Tax=Cricetulus griseus TaxID=10029 RepID=G3IA84_CRIGR|nr:Retrovirus-related Pol polyprotein LINE-1 [Cricetulus griseus]